MGDVLLCFESILTQWWTSKHKILESISRDILSITMMPAWLPQARPPGTGECPSFTDHQEKSLHGHLGSPFQCWRAFNIVIIFVIHKYSMLGCSEFYKPQFEYILDQMLWNSLTISILFQWYWKIPFQTKYRCLLLGGWTQTNNVHFIVRVWPVVPIGSPSILYQAIIKWWGSAGVLWVFLLPEIIAIMSIFLNCVNRGRAAMFPRECSVSWRVLR